MTRRVYLKSQRINLTPVAGGPKREAIWGDWLDVEETTPPSANFLIKWLNWNAQNNTVFTREYLVAKNKCQEKPLLEMIFLDVGQGDGCIVSVPAGNTQKTMMIDAGGGSNMMRFMRWKTRGFRVDSAFHAAVVTHSDTDHYRGFQSLFEEPAISFEKVYHNGLVERVAVQDKDVLGPRQNGFCTDVIADRPALQALLGNPANRGSKFYPKLMFTALQDPVRFGDIAMASTLTGEMQSGRTFLPGFAPSTASNPNIEILGPVPEPAGGKLRLREFGEKAGDGGFDVGKTKNGHSIILRLTYKKFRVVFGGDLNQPAEHYLLRHYGGIGATAPLASAVLPARARLGADLLKCCHHGSADVTDEFVEAVNPFAFVVSSGDEESHVHPRPDVLGLLGKKGRTARPLILCTEILRSTPESRAMTSAEENELDSLLSARDAATTPADKKKAREAITGFWNRRFRRLVNVYGAITIRTDGEKLLIAFRKEKKSAGSSWKLYEYKHANGEWAGGEV